MSIAPVSRSPTRRVAPMISRALPSSSSTAAPVDSTTIVRPSLRRTRSSGIDTLPVASARSIADRTADRSSGWTWSVTCVPTKSSTA
jgi:hypothetical protein